MATDLQAPNPIQPNGPNPGEPLRTKPAESNGWRTFGILVITVFFTTLFSYWLLAVYLFPTSFSPVKLDEGEQHQFAFVTLARKRYAASRHSAANSPTLFGAWSANSDG